jgi:hypothetical protein
MMMGIGLALATLGAILRYAIDDNSDSFDLATVGLIMMIVGSIAFATGVGLEVLKRPRQVPMPYAPPTPSAPSTTPPPQSAPPPPSHPH